MPFFNLPSSGSGSAAMLSGSGAPSSSLGSNGGFYLDTTNKKLYGPKTAGAWGTGIALTGADWDEITSKPATFAPSSHFHAVSDVTGLQTALDGKQASGSYAASTHSHAISDVTGLQTALDGKAATSHTHTIANVTGLQTALDGKQATGTCSLLGHSHLVADVTGLQTQLDGKAAASHAHAIAEVTGLQTALDGKQASGTYATLVSGVVPSSQLPSYVDDVLEYATLPATGETGKIYVNTTNGKIYRWSGSAFIEVIASPGTTDAITEGSTNLYFTSARAVSALSSSLAAKADVSHTHTIANVTGLQTALDGKQSAGSYAAATHTHTASQITDLATSVVTTVNGSSGAITLTKSSVGLSAVDNVADASKPVSTAQAAADAAVQAYSIQRANHTGTQAAATITGLASVATAGTYSSLSGIPSSFTPSAHTHSVADVSGLQEQLDGKQAAGTYATLVSSLVPTANLPKATTTTIGAVSVGSGLAVSDGVLSANGYTLPAATASTLGGIIVGTGLSIASGVLSVSGGGSGYTLPVATASVLGGVKTGSNVTIAADGTISVAAPATDASALTAGTLAAARLPLATSSAVGGVIVGGGLSVSSGTISADLRSNTTGITGAAAISNIVSLTAAQYAAIGTKNSSTLYIVAG